MKKKRFLLPTVTALGLILALSGCVDSGGGNEAAGGTTPDAGNIDGGGGDTSPVTETAVISGKVALSSLLGKPSANLEKMRAVPKGKPGSTQHKAALKKASAGSDSRFSGLPTRSAGDSLAGAMVQLFDADHPEWLFPIAEAATDASGNYTLEALINAENNEGATYQNGDPIPAGNYTLVAIEKDANGAVVSVANQTVVNEFTGTVTNDLVPQQVVETPPKVVTMFGVEKNTDGTQTWGDADLTVSPNVALQVTFSMAVDRQTVETGIGISPAVEGYWAISADGLTATLYLDDGVQLAQGESYTVTVKGSGGSDAANAIENILGVALEQDAMGYFTVPTGAQADLQAPTAQMVSPSLADIASPDGIDLITPIRIGSTEVMDVNDLVLGATPSLGAKPNVTYLGKNNGLYEYEFILGEPLKIGTTYSATVGGGKDLAGNEMNPLSVSFTTVTATAGVVEIPEDATEEEVATLTVLANAQSDVKDVFGKWYRAMNDRNLGQMQSLMAIDFALEYNATESYRDEDTNRDGRYDLNEFSDMLEQAFLYWDFCGTTMQGDVIGDINVVGDEADFEFKLTGESTQSTRECANAAPQESMFAKLQKINGAWFILKASEGIDTRNEEIQQAAVVELVQPGHGAVLDLGPDETGQEQTMTFEWTEVGDAASYVMIFMDDRDPDSGFAMVLPPTYTSIEIPPNDALFDEDNPTLAEVSEAFGFSREFEPRPGSELNWQIAALGSNTVQDILNDRATSLPKDVIAVSKLSRFKLAGDYQELQVTVATSHGEDLTFSEFIDGYDAGDAGEVTLTVTTPRLDATMGIVNVSGNTFQHYTYPIVDGVGTLTIQLNEGNNWIEVSDKNFYGGTAGDDCGPDCGEPMPVDCPPEDTTCFDMAGDCPPEDTTCVDMAGDCPPEDTTCVDPVISASADGGPGYQLVEWFNIQTTGGIPAVVAITSVMDQAGNVLENDGWDFYEAPAATSVTLTGTVNVTDFDFRELNVNLWNDRLGANSFRRVEMDELGNFSVEIELYQGENWINIGGESCDAMGCNWYSANMGVKTDLGVEWVPPVVISEVAYLNGTADGEIIERDNWGNGGNWEAIPADMTDPAFTVVIRGSLAYTSDPTDSNNVPRYNVGSEGGWMDDRISFEPDGSFELVVELFDGWNNIGINDVNGNWYGINITAEKAKKVIRPEILTIDGMPFDTALNDRGDYVTDQCSVTVEGTAMVGEVRVNWNGSGELMDGMWAGNWEEFLTETDAEGNFSATMPLIGGSAYNWSDNFLDINDANWNWMGVRIVTTGDCEYTPPQMAVTSVVANMDPSTPDDDAALSLIDDWGQGGRYGIVTDMDTYGYEPVATATVTVNGTSTVAGRTIKAEIWACGVNTRLGKVTSSDTADENGEFPWTMEVTVYPGGNTINLNDGPNWYNIDLQASNNNEPPVPPLSIDMIVDEAGIELSPEVDPFADPNACASNNRYDAGSAQTITISGVTSGRAPAEGEWYADGSFGRFDIAEDGSYSFEISLYDGFNWININDADWNNQGLEIRTNNGVQRPQFVEIQSHVQNGSADAGPITVTGVIYADPAGDGTGFKADFVNGYISSCGDTDCTWTEFSSDPNAAQWGALPVTLGEDADGNVTFTLEGAEIQSTTMMDETGAEVTTGAWTNIEVRADGMHADGGWAGHGHAIELNNGCTDCSERVWKPGQVAKSSANSAAVKATAAKRARVMDSRRAN